MRSDYNHLTHHLEVSHMPAFVCVSSPPNLSSFNGFWFVLTENQLHYRQSRKEKYLCAFLTKVAIHSFFFCVSLLTWPHRPNAFRLNWSGTGNRTHNMARVFVYRWRGGEAYRGGEKKKVMANDVSYYNLAFHPALALLLSPSSLWPGWAMGHFLEKHSTEQNDFKPTDGERSHFKDKDSPRKRATFQASARAHQGNMPKKIWRFIFSGLIFPFVQLCGDGRFWHL